MTIAECYPSTFAIFFYRNFSNEIKLLGSYSQSRYIEMVFFIIIMLSFKITSQYYGNNECCVDIKYIKNNKNGVDHCTR